MGTYTWNIDMSNEFLVSPAIFCWDKGGQDGRATDTHGKGPRAMVLLTDAPKPSWRGIVRGTEKYKMFNLSFIFKSWTLMTLD